jgi:hypothetical protein
MRIVQTLSGGVPSINFHELTVGATAVVAGQGLTLASGLLVTAKDAATPLWYIATEAGAASAVITAEEVTPDCVIMVPYTTGSPVVGAAYDLTTDGTGLLVADTTNPKVRVMSVDSTNLVCKCRVITTMTA